MNIFKMNAFQDRVETMIILQIYVLTSYSSIALQRTAANVAKISDKENALVEM